MNLANKLTLSRIVMTLIIIFILLFPWSDLGINFPSFIVSGKVLVDSKYLICGFLFVMACVTDYLDGQIARNSKKTTDFGAVMDAIADKILVNSVLIIFAYYGFISVIIPIIIIIRDTFIDALRVVAGSKKIIIKAGKLGKIKTACMMVGLSLMFFYNLPFEIWGIYLAEILIDVATVLSVVSGITYYLDWKEKVF